MDKQKTLKRLVAASKAIELLIAELKSEVDNHASVICPNCKREYPDNSKFTRGRCSSCYQKMNRKVNRNETTWVELEKEGACDPEEKAGRKPTPLIKEMADSAKKALSANRKNQKD